MVYFIALAFGHLFCYLKKQKWVLTISFLSLFFFLAFRTVDVGTDTLQYKVNFEILRKGGTIRLEWLWGLLNKVVIFFNGDFQYLLVLTAIFTLVPIYKVVRKQSPYPVLSVFLYITLYYYLYTFNIMRQGVALSLGLLAITSFIDKKYWWFLLWLICASLFHKSALVILPFVLLMRLFYIIKYKSTILLQIGSALIGLFFYKPLASLITHFVYSNYVLNLTLNFLGNFLAILISNTLFILISNLIKEKNEYYYGYFVWLITSNLLARIPFGGRVTMFMGVLQIIFLPLLLKNNKLERKQKSLILPVLAFYAFILFFRSFGSGGVFPYINMFF